MSEITDLVAALRAGQVSLDQVAERFRQRRWPEAAMPARHIRPGAEDRSLADPDPYVPGSFDDVAAALYRGELSLDEYRVLAQAAAESINAEP